MSVFVADVSVADVSVAKVSVADVSVANVSANERLLENDVPSTHSSSQQEIETKRATNQ